MSYGGRYRSDGHGGDVGWARSGGGVPGRRSLTDSMRPAGAAAADEAAPAASHPVRGPSAQTMGTCAWGDVSCGCPSCNPAGLIKASDDAAADPQPLEAPASDGPDIGTGGGGDDAGPAEAGGKEAASSDLPATAAKDPSAPGQSGLETRDAATPQRADAAQPAGPSGQAVAPPPPPTLTSRTVQTAPGDGNRARTTVAVGEVVDLTGSASGTWAASSGTPATGAASATFRWTAGNAPGTATITLTVGSATVSKVLTVVAPTSLAMTHASSHGLTAGTAGVCLVADCTVGASSVCFSNVEWLEVPGPASSISGYFSTFSAATLHHNPNPSWVRWNASNGGPRDHAAWHSVPGPYSAGAFTWVIPNKYRVAGSGAAGTVFTTTHQIFTMDAAGTMTVSKGGASVSRAP